MSTTTDASPKSFQFTLQHLLLAIVACSIWLAAVVQLGVIGFLACYAATSLIVMSLGAYWRKSGLILCGLAMFGFGCCLFNPDMGSRESSRRASCMNSLRQIEVALHSYHADYGSFPPAYIANANGKPMHSWRVLILPYMEQQALYERYNFNEPWDGPNNRKLHNVIMKSYCCPSRSDKQPKTETNYVVVVGPQTMWPGDKATKLTDVKDGTSNTIMLVEFHDSGIHWMEPRDLHTVQMPMAINAPRGQGICSLHPHGANAILADGSVRFLSDKTPPDALRAALTIAGSEKTALP
jgi:Protein of unknown function (DUF1559)